MARDRDHAAVSARTLAEGRRAIAAWNNYVASAEALAGIRECPAIWPSSTADIAPTRCELIEGHIQRDGARHRRRILGSQVVVEW